METQDRRPSESQLPHGKCPVPRRISSLRHTFKVEEPVSGESDTAAMKILYPTNNTRPLPVVIFFSGIDVESNRYQWLSEQLVENCDVIVATYDMFASAMGQTMLIFTGSTKRSPDHPNPAVMMMITEQLCEINDEGPLKGTLDLTRIVLGGHSAGGRGALMDVSRDFANRIKGRFTYGAHLAILISEGVAPGSISRLGDNKPVLLMAGTRDGVIAQSWTKYGIEWESAVDPIERTFAQSFSKGTPACLFEFEGFNHFAMTDPDDCTHMSIEKDFEATVPKEEMKKKLAEIVTLFVKETAWGDWKAGSELRGYAQKKDPLFASQMIQLYCSLCYERNEFLLQRLLLVRPELILDYYCLP